METEPEARQLTERYPWHDTLWRGVIKDPARLPHALLFAGQPGLGKANFAERLAQALLCQMLGPGGESCGTCKSCRLCVAGTHPDLMRVSPLEEGKPITVDQVRALVEFVTKRPHIASRKVVVMVPAETMNLNAANSLLKMLEEPPLGNVFLLVTDQPAKLPPTVRSRCHRLDFGPVRRPDALAWLQTRDVSPSDAGALLDLAAGAPLQALALANNDFLRTRDDLLVDLESLRDPQADPVACAARWGALGPERCLRWLQSLLADLIKLKLLPEDDPYLANADLAPRLRALAEGLDWPPLYAFADTVAEACDLLTGPLDRLLLLEDILIRWKKANQE